MFCALLGHVTGFWQPKRDKYKEYSDLLVGHRGCRGIEQLPENSLASFQYALDKGADAIELDCHLSNDGAVVVIHDDTVDRMLDGTGEIRHLKVGDLKRMRYRNAPSTLTCPLLEEVCELVKQHNEKSGKQCKIFVELKGWKGSWALATKVCNVIKEAKAQHICCLISFNPLLLLFAHIQDKSLVKCMLYMRGLLRSVVQSKVERLPWLLYYGYFIADPILSFLSQQRCFLFLIGATMVGPHQSMVSREMRNYYTKHQIGIYTWVVNEQPQLDFFRTNLQISVGTDVLFP